MPLCIAALMPDGTWAPLPSSPGSVSDNPPGGGRQVYRWHCPAEGTLVIQRSGFGMDGLLADGMVRQITSAGFELVARLGKGDPPYELRFRPDHTPEEERCLRLWVE